MDMCSGPLLKKIITFVIPLMLSGILQLLYNAADIVVVGRFSGKASLAAVGSTGALINLIINIFMGLSVGACVITAQRFGAGDRKALSDVVHTSMLAALICGVVVGVAGFFLARPMLAIMDTPDDVIDKAALYVRIYFAGLPALMLYNFGASILRGIGDTRRPLYFLTASGLVNIVLNVVFVVVFKMDVAGVATATVISEIISAVLVVLVLMRSDTDFKLELKAQNLQKRACQHDQDRTSGRNTGLGVLFFKCYNSVVDKFLRLGRNGRKCRRKQYRGLYIHLDERRFTGVGYLYRSGISEQEDTKISAGY